MQAHDDASALDHVRDHSTTTTTTTKTTNDYNSLQALNYILPPLEAQFALLSDMHDAAVRNRKFVDRDRINTIAGEKLHNIRSQIESQLVHIAEQEKREQLQKIGVQIAELQASSGVSTEPQWTLLEQQLEQLPTDDVDAMRLRDQLSRARQNQQDHELLYANLKNELSALQRHTDDVDANIRPYLEEVHTSKSGKKKKTKPAEKSFDIDQQIIDIRRALDDLQNHAMPQLGDLQRKADLNNVILDAAAPLQDRLSRLIDEYQVHHVNNVVYFFLSGVPQPKGNDP